jgi:preprotein translocase subunit SecA
MVQRPHHFAIVDEVDSILIDEARTPLIISGPAEESTDKYYRANQIVVQLKGRRITESEEVDAKHKKIDLGEGFDYLAEEKSKSVSLTEQGEKKGAELFGVEHLHDISTVEYRHHLIQALRAKEFFRRDVDYVVKEGKVVIVDEFTGRMMPGRRWSDGLHQAVEAKENIRIERENQTLATITFQNYFRMYAKLAGMTGTAYTEANEFKQIYNLDVVVIPTNKPLARKNYPDCIYKTQAEKYNAVVEEISECNKRGQPVLVGTISIEKSELIGRLLMQKGVKHQVLNAKFHEMEAQIIAQAGRYAGVTIATNMAGRGTDIVLGGNAEFLAKQLLAKELKAEISQEEKQQILNKFIEQFRDQTRQERQQVLAAGGLRVIGTERHESRRIDNQLRGRSGRQGDPGETRFYVSLQDDLMRLFASDRIMFVMDKLGMKEGEVIESRMVSGALEVAQKRVEGFNFEIRKQLLDYDNVMNKQREVIYTMRRSILEGENLKDVVLDSIFQSSDQMIEMHLAAHEEKQAALSALALEVQDKFGLDIKSVLDRFNDLTQEEMMKEMGYILEEFYQKKEEMITPSIMRRMERMLLLHVIDNKWKDHLHVMDQIKEGIGLRALGQRDPLVEYKKEAFAMFKSMYASINQEIASLMFKLEPPREENRVRSVFADIEKHAIHQDFEGMKNPQQQGVLDQEIREGEMKQASQPLSAMAKVGRNDTCPCGSGKKYKKCHGA